MIWIKKWVRNFFGFSRSQVNGFVILLPIIALALFSEPLWHWWVSQRPMDIASDRKKLDSLIGIWRSQPVEESNEKSFPKQKLFAFNPNMVNVDDLVSLGFSQQLAKRIVNYRIKGGRFTIKSDLLKIYGIDSTFYQQIRAYISLPERNTTSKPRVEERKPKNVVVKEASQKFDLNKADTSKLKKIYGIGDKLSLRILKYRDVLGGFVDMTQLKEVYGLDSIVIERIVTNSMIEEGFEPKKININAASEKQLSAHPYLKKVARGIISYRFQHGDFRAVEDIRNVSTLDEKSIRRIIPYIKVDGEM